jgi:hypothetical protein
VTRFYREDGRGVIEVERAFADNVSGGRPKIGEAFPTLFGEMLIAEIEERDDIYILRGKRKTDVSSR